MWHVRLVICSALIACALAEAIHRPGDRSDFKRSLGKNCDKSYSLTCLKLDIVGWVDGLNEKGDISVLPGISIVRENVSTAPNTAELVAEIGREFPNNPDARLDAFVLKKIQGFLGSHSLKMNFGEAEEGDNAVTGRKKKGKGGGGMGMLFAYAAMMKSTMFALGMGAVAALAGKALMTSLISLVLSAIIGLKSLTSGGEKTTYEVVSKPVYTHSNWHQSSANSKLVIMFSRSILYFVLVTSAVVKGNDFKRSLGKDCGKSYSLTCLKLDIVGWVDGLNEKGDINVIPGVSILRENYNTTANTADIIADIGREFPNNPDARLDAFLLKKVQSFMESHSLKLNFAEEVEDENAVTGRKKKKGGDGGMQMMLAFAGMMKSTLFAIGLGAVAALAGKALMTGMISLLLSGIIGLKSLTSGGHSSHEVVHAGVQDDHHGGWGRSYEKPLPLGLRPEYKPA
ncbi:unnamed protein product [Phyllotreta striolata]|uniref:Uncharacterized protein n=1 Tax=Phyllotreta striolata TaxID=444603 RepID=A0A9N9TR16_PHYSR|nr:unnamed protein product [Phyllotreta striolata]